MVGCTGVLALEGKFNVNSEVFSVTSISLMPRDAVPKVVHGTQLHEVIRSGCSDQDEL